MNKILGIAQKYNIDVIEDAACALGTVFNNKNAGTFGKTGCFSFHPRKSVTTGEGGAIVTSDKNIYHRIQLIKNHGITFSEGKYDLVLPGLNYRMTNILAALGRVQLKKMHEKIAFRTKLAKKYMELLSDLPNIVLPDMQPGHSWQSYMILLESNINRDSVIKGLKKMGLSQI